MPPRMPPKNKVEAVTLHNEQDARGRWVPTRYEINSWVTLQPDVATPWGRDYARFHEDSPQALWKAQIKAFEVVPDSPDLVTRVRVRHAYEPRQLKLDPCLPQPRLRCNYLFPCYYEDWVHPASILGVIVAMHADIGELVHHDRSHRELLNASVYFFKWVYAPPAGTELYGVLEELPLPSFNSKAWPLPDMSTSECFRAKMRNDFRGAMKANTGSRRTHAQWFMPIGVFVDLFASAPNRVKTRTLFSFRNLEEDDFHGLMDQGWDQKVEVGGDIIRCTANRPSIVFRYHIGRQTLYVNFNFTREKMVGREWIAMDEDPRDQLVLLKCDVIDSDPHIQMEFNVGRDWPLLHLRQEVQIAMGTDAPTEFTFCVTTGNGPDRKINRRSEKNATVSEVLPPKQLKIMRLDHVV